MSEKEKVGSVAVKYFMDRKAVTLVRGTRIHLAIQALGINHVGGAPVVDESGRAVGYLSEYDLLMQAALSDLTDSITYAKDLVAVGPEATLSEALVIFHKKKIKALPVVSSSGHVMGVVTRMALLQKMISA